MRLTTSFYSILLDRYSLMNKISNHLFYIGIGNATEVINNRRVFGHFVGARKDCKLNCTIIYESIQTDTVWSIEGYKAAEESIQNITNDEIFQVSGNQRAFLSASNTTYGNHLNILDCSVRDLNGTTVYCGSYVNPKQASFNFTVCGELM